MRVLDWLRSTHSNARNIGSIRLMSYGLVVCCIELFRASEGLAETSEPVKDTDSWPVYGRTSDESHYSPLDDINSHNASRLGLAWWFDGKAISASRSGPMGGDR